jgi:cell division initiation protein
MRITPLEIRQKTFEKNFRGYEKDEVHGFLLTLSQEWERLQDENKELRMKLESTEREVLKLREVETSLFKTLKTAEDTGANVIDQARKAAELHLKESQLKADAMMHEARSKARDTIEESEVRAKEIVAEMEERLKLLIDNYKKLETSREDLLGDLKRLGTDLLEKVDRSKLQTKDFDPDKHYNAIKRETKKIIYPNYEERTSKTELKSEPRAEMKPLQPEPVGPVEETPVKEKMAVVGESQPKKQKSFFDEIG